MSEGPEVRRTADRLAEVLVGRRVEKVELRKRSVAPGDQLAAKVVGTRVKAVRTHGKHIVIAFTGSLYLHNHMMMWGKWRTYPRRAYEEGKAKPPPRVQWRRARGDLNTQVVTVEDVRADSRVRLILATGDHVVIEFNGPIVRFSKADPAKQGVIERLGPDALVRPFSSTAVRARARERGTKNLADLLLDQTFVAGIGNKYKSDIMFRVGLYPFRRVSSLAPAEMKALIAGIPRMLRFGYENAGRTRPLRADERGNSWDNRHWVFRRGGRPCWQCGAVVRTDRTSSTRVTFWCPTCQADS